MKHLITVLLLLCSFQFLIAQDAGLSVQGILRNSDGTAVENGDYSINFKLYDAKTGGTVIWEETQEEVSIKGGIYSIILGETNPLTAAFDQKYFLGISIEGGDELIPRTELTSSPYALSLIGEDNVFPSSGNVGVGDDNPLLKLTVKRDYGRIGLDVSGGYLTTIIGASDKVEFKNDASRPFVFNAGGINLFNIGLTGPSIRGEAAAYTRYYTNAADKYAYVGYAQAGSSAFKIVNTSGAITMSATTLTMSGGRSYFNDQLDVKVNGRSLTSVGTDHSYLAFYPQTVSGGQLGKFGYLTANTPDLSISNTANGGDIVLDSGSGTVNVSDRLNVGGHLQVGGSAYYGLTNYDWLANNGTGSDNSSGGDPGDMAIWSNGNVMAKVFFAYGSYSTSDRRIKKDYKLSNGLEDLKTLHQIEVTDYRHVDRVTLGTDYKKGLIAQQVAEVFPEAIKKITDYLPSIYSFPNQISIEENITTFTLDEAHDLKLGDKLKMITDKGDEFFTVADVLDAKSFTIETTVFSEEAKSVFIYGKEVDDFHTVDYDRVYTLCVSAVQELSRQVDELKNKNFTLEQANSDLRHSHNDSVKENNKITSEMKALLDRVQNIEQILSLTASN